MTQRLSSLLLLLMSLVLSVGILEASLPSGDYGKKVWGSEEETVECEWKEAGEEGAGGSCADRVQLDETFGGTHQSPAYLTFIHKHALYIGVHFPQTNVPLGYSSQPRTRSLPKRYILFCSSQDFLG